MPVISFYTRKKKENCLKPLSQSVKADVSHLIVLELRKHFGKNLI